MDRRGEVKIVNSKNMNRNGLIDVNCIVEKNQHVKSFNVGIELSEYLAWPVASRLTSSKLLAASGFEAGIKLCLQRCLDYRFDLTIQSMTRVLQVLSYWITFGSCMACEVCVCVCAVSYTHLTLPTKLEV